MLRPRWTPWRLALGAVPLAMLASLLAGEVSANGSPPPVRAAHAPSFFKATSPGHGKALASPGRGRHRLVTLRRDLIPQHPGGQQVRFDLFARTSVVGTFESKAHGHGFTVWSGRLDATDGYFQVAKSGSTYLISLSSLQGSYHGHRHRHH